jgi:phosphatidylglycerophosphate synthase
VSEASQNRDSDYVDKAMHKFDHVLDLVHDKLLRPILLAGRVIAYGFIVLLASIVLFGALVIGLVRLFNVYLFAGHEWLSYLVIGAISLVTGLIIWRRRRPVDVRK